MKKIYLYSLSQRKGPLSGTCHFMVNAGHADYARKIYRNYRKNFGYSADQARSEAVLQAPTLQHGRD